MTLSKSKVTREQAIEECWYRGNLSFLWHAGQRAIENALSKVVAQLFVMNIARQFGKSYYLVSKAIAHAIKNPKSRIKYATAFQSDLLEFILPAFEAVLETCPQHLRPKYQVQGNKFIFSNGSEIKLVGLDKSPNGLRGNTVDMIILDEAGFITNLHYIYVSVIIPATLHRPNCLIFMSSTPPSTPAHAFNDYAQKAEIEGAYIKMTIYDNPLITEKDIDRMAKEMGGKESTSFRRECLCEFVTDSDSAIIPEWKDEYIQDIPRDEFYVYYHKYVGMDLGVKDLTANIYGYYDFKRAALIIEDETEMKGAVMNSLLLVNSLKQKEKELWGEMPVFRRIVDNNWPLLVLDLSSIHNMPFISVVKDSLEAMINEVRLMVQAGQIIIHPRCKKLIGCLKYGVWDAKKKQFARSPTYGHFDHLAALIYMVRYLAKHTNPVPIEHGFEAHRAWLYNIRDKKSTTPNAAVFNKLLNNRKNTT